MSTHAATFSQHAIAGVGVGFRAPHGDDVLRQKPAVGWFEILADNYMTDAETAHRQLTAVRENYPITLHSVGMSLGSVEPLDFDYLQGLKALTVRYESAWVSDHLCFVNVDGTYFHDLLPLPYTEEALHHTAARIRQVQDYLGQRILIENVSSYVSYRSSEMDEVEFLNGVAEEADCDILLDLNNLYVSAYNHRTDVNDLLRTVTTERVRQVHLGGFQQQDEYLVDTHSRPVSPVVWKLFADFAGCRPTMPVLIEWDNDLPDFASLLVQVRQAESILATGGQARGKTV